MFQVVSSWVNSTSCLQISTYWGVSPGEVKIKTGICQSPKATRLMKQQRIALAEIRAPLSGQKFAAFPYHHMVVLPVQLFLNILHCFQNYWREHVISSALAIFLPNLLPLCSNNLEAEITELVETTVLNWPSFFWMFSAMRTIVSSERLGS